MTEKQSDSQSHLKKRLYQMITEAKPVIQWEAENLWQRLERKKLERDLKKEISLRLAYHWKHFDQLADPQREALDDFLTIQERKLKLEDFLWEKGLRHGDHILVYNPIDGSFREKVMTKFDFIFLQAPDMAKQYEESRGDEVKLEDRTKHKSQPDLSSYETSWLINIK